MILPDKKEEELVDRCIESGFKKVIEINGLDKLNKYINTLIQKRTVHVSFYEIGIDPINPPERVKKALKYMEQRYLKIKHVDEVVNYLDTRYKTLSVNFAKAGIINPKSLLTYLKIRHALYLLKKTNLFIKQIAYYIGYKNSKRFIENFKKMFNKSPGKAKSELRNSSVDEFWRKNLNY